jgi:hypothetical protein
MENKKRLIDANALRQELQKIIDETQKWRTQKAGKTEAWLYVDEIYKLDNWLGIYAECADLLDDAPTVDAVEVVRCKDCKKRETCRTTNVWAVMPGDDWYCADGERKTDV